MGYRGRWRYIWYRYFEETGKCFGNRRSRPNRRHWRYWRNRRDTGAVERVDTSQVVVIVIVCRYSSIVGLVVSVFDIELETGKRGIGVEWVTLFGSRRSRRTNVPSPYVKVVMDGGT